MGQVPVLYLLIGKNGRLGRHLQRYLSCLDLPYRAWGRADGPLPLDGVTHTLLALPDDAIEPFLASHPGLQGTTVVHFSGSLVTPSAWGAHPLMTFAGGGYGIEDYAAIHFVVDADAPPLGELLPGLPNPWHRLDPQLKARYHAECVLSGNFTAMLWAHFFQVLEGQLGLPRSAALPYLRRVAANLESEEQPLTGPLVRGDRATVERNLRALEGDPYQAVYTSFVEAYAR